MIVSRAFVNNTNNNNNNNNNNNSTDDEGRAECVSSLVFTLVCPEVMRNKMEGVSLAAERLNCRANIRRPVNI